MLFILFCPSIVAGIFPFAATGRCTRIIHLETGTFGSTMLLRFFAQFTLARFVKFAQEIINCFVLIS